MSKGLTERKYTVYKHISPSGKIYIGITINKPKYRWKNGNGYKNNPYFWNAICKYGWENFTHEILFENFTKEEACEKEQELIKFYHANDPEYGYNLTEGGEGNRGFYFHYQNEKTYLNIVLDYFLLVGKYNIDGDIIEIDYLDILILSKIDEFEKDNRICFISAQEFSEIFNCSLRTIHRKLKDLRQIGFITTQNQIIIIEGHKQKRSIKSINYDTIEKYLN